MAGPLYEELEKRLPWLFQDLGFRVVHHDYSPKQMGDSVAELQSDTLRIRFIRDRGIFVVKLSPPGEPPQWMEAGFLWNALTGNRPEPELEGWAWFIRDHLPELTKALGPQLPDTREKYDRRQEESRKILARYIPPVTLLGRLRQFKATPWGMIFMGPLGWIVTAGLLGFWFFSK